MERRHERAVNSKAGEVKLMKLLDLTANLELPVRAFRTGI
jgi:hypothetical protein